MEQALFAEVMRGGQVESRHLGSVAVVGVDGELLYSAGDPHLLTFTRSALKPFQAVPLVHAGGLERFGFNGAETALLCASHSGEARHIAAVQSMLKKIGCDEAQLRCGCHAPIYDGPGAVAPPFSQLHNNCSGKHAGFLAYCVQHRLPPDNYIDLQHPLQQAVRHSVAHFSGVPADDLVAGIDGCSAPNYALPLSRLAWAYAQLARPALDAEYGDALSRLFTAMTAHPDMVAGTGRFDLALMQEMPGDLVAKGGAEGVQAIGIRSAGLGIAMKVADGNARALYPAAIAVLKELGLLDAAAMATLAAWARPVLRNLRGLQVGDIRATLRLVKAAG